MRIPILLIGAMVFTAPAAAQEASTAVNLALRTSIKVTGLAFRLTDPAFRGDRNRAESLLRIRLEPSMRVGDTTLTVAYEQRLRLPSDGNSGASAILPGDNRASYRVRQLAWDTAGSTVTWLHELDRASAQFNVRQAEITLGRQAVGWGRGVMFGAVDLFSPFTPLEVDREWRRGVDAVRADLKLTDRSSLDVVAAFGDSWQHSATAARLRGYTKRGDFEVMTGKRGRDLFGGVSASAAIASAEIHGELAVFRVPREEGLDAVRTVSKVVVGGSCRVPVGSGILAYVEYHYSGFGAPRAGGISARLRTPAYIERYLRGDTQILSRHAVAVIASYERSPEVGYSGRWLHNPADGSGVIVPGMTFTWSDGASVVGSAYVPYGAKPANGLLRSEYGGAALAALVQLRLYL